MPISRNWFGSTNSDREATYYGWMSTGYILGGVLAPQKPLFLFVYLYLAVFTRFSPPALENGLKGRPRKSTQGKSHRDTPARKTRPLGVGLMRFSNWGPLAASIRWKLQLVGRAENEEEIMCILKAQDQEIINCLVLDRMRFFWNTAGDVWALHRWFSGRMLACHAGGPGSIPGRCIFFYSDCEKVASCADSPPRPSRTRAPLRDNPQESYSLTYRPNNIVFS
ncbi:hypothetical protein AAG570_004594 [Ranatra chinensis]|uniref:Uncharacterized protein n=1 Tax=Ranatra chinensis TaxID=642074 RepID=A0ABD0YFZ9_9HEMI